MTQHVRFTGKVEISENSDYSNPELVRSFKFDLDVDEWFYYLVEADTGPASLAISEMDTVTSLMVVNEGSVAVDVGYTDTGSDARVIACPAGEWIRVADVDPSVAVTLTTASSSSLCRVFVCGT